MATSSPPAASSFIRRVRNIIFAKCKNIKYTGNEYALVQILQICSSVLRNTETEAVADEELQDIVARFPLAGKRAIAAIYVHALEVNINYKLLRVYEAVMVNALRGDKLPSDVETLVRKSGHIKLFRNMFLGFIELMLSEDDEEAGDEYIRNLILATTLIVSHFMVCLVRSDRTYRRADLQKLITTSTTDNFKRILGVALTTQIKQLNIRKKYWRILLDHNDEPLLTNFILDTGGSKTAGLVTELAQRREQQLEAHQQLDPQQLEQEAEIEFMDVHTDDGGGGSTEEGSREIMTAVSCPMDEVSFHERYMSMWKDHYSNGMKFEFKELYNAMQDIATANWFNDDFIVNKQSGELRQHQIYQNAVLRLSKQHLLNVQILEQCETARSGAGLTIPTDMPVPRASSSSSSNGGIDEKLELAQAHLRISGKYISKVNETYTHIIFKDVFDTMIHGATYRGDMYMRNKHPVEVVNMLKRLRSTFETFSPNVDKKSAWEATLYTFFPPASVPNTNDAMYQTATAVHGGMVDIGVLHETIKRTFSSVVAENFSATSSNEDMRSQHDRYQLTYDMCTSGLSTAARTARSMQALIKQFGTKFKVKSFLTDPAYDPINAAPFAWTTDAFPLLWLINSADFVECGAASKYVMSCAMSSIVRGLNVMCTIFRATARASYACAKALEAHLAFKELVRQGVIQSLTARATKAAAAAAAAAGPEGGAAAAGAAAARGNAAHKATLDKLFAESNDVAEMKGAVKDLLRALSDYTMPDTQFKDWLKGIDTKYNSIKDREKWVDPKYKQPKSRTVFSPEYCDVAGDDKDPNKQFPFESKSYDSAEFSSTVIVGSDRILVRPPDHLAWIREHNVIIRHLADLQRKKQILDRFRPTQAAGGNNGVSKEELEECGIIASTPAAKLQEAVQTTKDSVNSVYKRMIKYLRERNCAVPPYIKGLEMNWQIRMIRVPQTAVPPELVALDRQLVKLYEASLKDPLLRARYDFELHRFYQEYLRLFSSRISEADTSSAGASGAAAQIRSETLNATNLNSWTDDNMRGKPELITIERPNESFHITGCGSRESVLVELLYDSLRRLVYTDGNYIRAFKFLKVIGERHAADRVVNMVKERLYREQQLRMTYKDDLDKFKCTSMDEWSAMQDVIMVLSDNATFLNNAYGVERITELLYDVPDTMINDIVNVHNAYLHDFIDFIEHIGLIEDSEEVVVPPPPTAEAEGATPPGPSQKKAPAAGKKQNIATIMYQMVTPEDFYKENAKQRAIQIMNKRKEMTKDNKMFGKELVEKFDADYNADSDDDIDIQTSFMRHWVGDIADYANNLPKEMCRTNLTWRRHAQMFQTKMHRFLSLVLLGEYGYEATSLFPARWYAINGNHLEHLVVGSRFRIPRQTTYRDADFVVYPRKAVFPVGTQFTKTIFVHRIPSYHFKMLSLSPQCTACAYQLMYSHKLHIDLGFMSSHSMGNVPILMFATGLMSYSTNGHDALKAVINTAKSALAHIRIQMTAPRMRGAKQFFTLAIMDGVSARCISSSFDAKDHGCVLARLTGARLPPPSAVNTVVDPCTNNCYIGSYEDPVDFSQWEDPMIEDTLPATKDDISTVPRVIAQLPDPAALGMKMAKDALATVLNATADDDIFAAVSYLMFTVRRCVVAESMSQFRETLVKFWARKARLLQSLSDDEKFYNMNSNYYDNVLETVTETIDDHRDAFSRIWHTAALIFADKVEAADANTLVGRLLTDAAQKTTFTNLHAYAKALRSAAEGTPTAAQLSEFKNADLEHATNWVVAINTYHEWLMAHDRQLQVEANRLMNAWYTIHPPPSEEHMHRQLYGLVFKRIGQVGRVRRRLLDEPYIDAMTCTHKKDYQTFMSAQGEGAPVAVAVPRREGGEEAQPAPNPLDNATMEASAGPISASSPISKLGDLINSRRRVIKHMLDGGHKFDPSFDMSHVGMTIAKDPSGPGTLGVYTQDEMNDFAARKKKLVSSKDAFQDPYAIRPTSSGNCVESEFGAGDGGDDKVGCKYVDSCGNEHNTRAITLQCAGDIHRHGLMREYGRVFNNASDDKSLGTCMIDPSKRSVTAMGGGDPLCNISFSLDHTPNDGASHGRSDAAAAAVIEAAGGGGSGYSRYGKSVYPSAYHRRLFKHMPNDFIGALVARTFGHLLIFNKHAMDDNVEADAVRMFYEEISRMSWTILGVVLATMSHTIFADMMRYGEILNTNTVKVIGNVVYKALNTDKSLQGHQRMRIYSTTGNVVNDIRFALYDRLWLTGGMDTIFCRNNNTAPVRLSNVNVGPNKTIKTHFGIDRGVDRREIENLQREYPNVKFSSRKRSMHRAFGYNNDGVPRLDTVVV